jgi:hypothetical protein
MSGTPNIPCGAVSAGSVSESELEEVGCRCLQVYWSQPQRDQIHTAVSLHAQTAQCRGWRLTFLFFLLLHCAFAERLPPRCQVTFRRHGLVRADRGWLGLAVAHARRVGLVLRCGRHGGRAAERRSSSRTEYRGLRTIAGCCGVAAAQGGPAEWACRRHRNGATLRRRSVASARIAGLRGVSWCSRRPWAQGEEQGEEQGEVAAGCSAGAARRAWTCSRRELVRCGALRACEQRDVVAAAARVVQQGAGVSSSRLEGERARQSVPGSWRRRRRRRRQGCRAGGCRGQ